MIGAVLAAALVWSLLVAGPAASGKGDSAEPLTSLWVDNPADGSRVRIDSIPGISEPSDLLLVDGDLYTISDNLRDIYRIAFDGPNAAPRRAGSWQPEGLPPGVDLEALSRLPSGQVLVASETHGNIFVLSPFPDRACAAWTTGIDGRCFIGRSNCGIEAMAVLPNGRLFVAKERDPRAAYLFDLPSEPCKAAVLEGRIYLELPTEVGPDISAATYDESSGHLFIVARSEQKVLEFELPDPPPGETSPIRLRLLGSFGYGRSEDALDYVGLDFHQVEGIVVGADRVLYLVVDNNGRKSRSFGNYRGALMRFFPSR